MNREIVSLTNRTGTITISRAQHDNKVKRNTMKVGYQHHNITIILTTELNVFWRRAALNDVLRGPQRATTCNRGVMSCDTDPSNHKQEKWADRYRVFTFLIFIWPSVHIVISTTSWLGKVRVQYLHRGKHAMITSWTWNSVIVVHLYNRAHCPRTMYRHI